MLTVARALAFRATLMPSTLALISNMFRDPVQRGSHRCLRRCSPSASRSARSSAGDAATVLVGSVFARRTIMLLLLASGLVLLPVPHLKPGGRTWSVWRCSHHPVAHHLRPEELATVGGGRCPWPSPVDWRSASCSYTTAGDSSPMLIWPAAQPHLHRRVGHDAGHDAHRGRHLPLSPSTRSCSHRRRCRRALAATGRL